MLKLIGYRLLLAVPQLLIIGLVAFSLTYLVPGSPAAAILGMESSPDRIAAVESELGLDQPVHVRLVDYFSGAIQGDLGESYRVERPVTTMLFERLPATLSMVVGGLLVAIVLGFAMGLLAGTRVGSRTDRGVMAVTSVTYAIPQFWMGLMLLLVFSIQFGWVPIVSYVPFTESPWLWARGIILPSLALGIAASSLIARQFRAGMANAVTSNYAASLMAVGVSRRRFYLRYGLRNALVPALAATGLAFVILVGASMAVERVFSVPGLGGILLTSVTGKDFPVVQGGVLVVAVLVIALNMLIDMCYGLIDPRTRPQ